MKLNELPKAKKPSADQVIVVDDGVTTSQLPVAMPVAQPFGVLRSDFVDLTARTSAGNITSENGVPLVGLDSFTPEPVKKNGFSVVQQTLNNNKFYSALTYEFRAERMTENLRELGNGWMRDFVLSKQKTTSNYGALIPMYGCGFENIDPDPELYVEVAENIALLDYWYNMYDRIGLNVVLCAQATAPISNGGHVKANALFGDMIAAFIARHPCIKCVELHNEANLSTFWSGTTQEYVDVYRPIAKKIREARRDIRIAFSGPSVMWWQPAIDWLTGIFDAGALDFCDAICCHPYRAASSTVWPPEAEPFFNNPSPQPTTHPNYTDGNSYETAAAAYYAWMSSYKPNMPVFYTEIGYSAGTGGSLCVGTDAKQAAWLSRLMLMDMDLSVRNIVPIKAISWYQFTDSGTGSSQERALGLIRYDHDYKKPSYWAYKSICQYFHDWTDLTPLNIAVTASAYNNAVKTKAWRKASNGKTTLAFWRLDQIADPTNDFTATLSFNPGFTVSSVKQFMPGKAMGDGAGVSFVQDGSGVVTITTIVSWRAQWFEIG